MKKSSIGIIKLKIRFLNFLDFLLHKDDFEKGKLMRLEQGQVIMNSG